MHQYETKIWWRLALDARLDRQYYLHHFLPNYRNVPHQSALPYQSHETHALHGHNSHDDICIRWQNDNLKFYPVFRFWKHNVLESVIWSPKVYPLIYPQYKTLLKVRILEKPLYLGYFYNPSWCAAFYCSSNPYTSRVTQHFWLNG